MLTAIQATLSTAVRERLNASSVSFTESIEDETNEVVVLLVIDTAHEGLGVAIQVLDDQFHFWANEAKMCVHRAVWEHAEDWVATCSEVVDSLLSNDPRIRVRRTAFGGSAGAVWIASAAGWNGERRTYEGEGTEYVFPAPWYRSKWQD